MSYTPPRLIYFIKPVGMDGPIKIGCTSVPERRLEELAVWSPWPLEIVCTAPGGYKDEHFLHCCFADSHSHGEWFRCTPKLRSTMEIVVASGSLVNIRRDLAPVGSIRAGKRRRFTPERRRYLSYSHRVNWAIRKLRRLGEDTAWYSPDDVDQIIRAWAGNAYRGIPGIEPTAEQIARLEEYLTDPAAHSVIPEWRRKKEAA